jgi:hypothetical protein
MDRHFDDYSDFKPMRKWADVHENSCSLRSAAKNDVTKVNGRTTEPSKDGLRPRVTTELGDDLGFLTNK